MNQLLETLEHGMYAAMFLGVPLLLGLLGAASNERNKR